MAEIEQSNAKDTLLGVLTYIDSPFKLAVVVLLAVLSFTGYFIYSNQSFLIAAYDKNKALPKIDVSRSDDVAKMLIKEANADVVAIFEVDIMLGTRVLVRAYTKEGRDKAHDGLDVGMLSNNADNNSDLISLYAGNIPCGSYTRAQSIVGLWYIQQGANFLCRSSMPIAAGQFAGQLTVGWKTPPENINKVQDMMIIASNMMIKR
ncbi:hypothetical protein UFOVP193_10 [uncultured Caudovirales phage]|uniref:Uncharacterized protein n=1 Tax=uncultured Caudovirales phage TaxID=2100421 RepID=A0A6J7WJ84_9CAUD|nr:hypothetical protein UFOVP193_10 [uncultured Caudovirales phage]